MLAHTSTSTTISLLLTLLLLVLVLPAARADTTTHTNIITDINTNTITAATVTIIGTTRTTYIAAPTTPPSPQYTDALTLRTSLLNSTNLFRWQHNASYIPWNASLATYAASYAAKCVWAHSHGPQGYGENLARGYVDVTASVDAWGDERALYDFGTADGANVTGFTEATGHFTQLVWKDTQSVGCGAYNCNGTNGLQGWMFVCEYWPPGNIEGSTPKTKNKFFKENVQAQVREGEDGFNTYSATVGATGVTGTATADGGQLTGSASASASGAVSGAPRLRLPCETAMAMAVFVLIAMCWGVT